MKVSAVTLCLLAVSGWALAAGPATLYTTASTPLSAQAAKGSIGTVAALTPVTVLAKKGSQSQVRIAGWTLSDFPSQLFQDAGVRIEHVRLDEDLSVDPKKLPHKTVQGNDWIEVSVVGWLPSKALTASRAGLLKAGQKQLGDACSSCHGQPTANHFTANQWASQLPERGGRTGHSRVGANEVMFKYLQLNAKP